MMAPGMPESLLTQETSTMFPSRWMSSRSSTHDSPLIGCASCDGRFFAGDGSADEQQLRRLLKEKKAADEEINAGSA